MCLRKAHRMTQKRMMMWKMIMEKMTGESICMKSFPEGKRTTHGQKTEKSFQEKCVHEAIY